MIRKFLVGILFFLLISCGKNEKPIVAFYYWKTIFKLSQTEQEVLRDNDVSKLYIRYFDIGLQPKTQEPIPISPIRFKENLDQFDIVPVIFIQN